ncbi:MAG: DUF1553 domain-containing protein [Verrucomicrobiaceae bacterium]|nr:DUF1553 domain-containing protein [Verrucomicrobiaceae bacterium]
MLARPITLLGLLVTTTTGLAELSFNKDIRPLLSDHCFSCHGPDEKGRKAKLRLDQQGADMKEVLERLESHDQDEIMPPPEANKPLTTAQKAKIREWIDQGAVYQRHWAFEPLQSGSFRSIDECVAASLHARGLDFAPETEPAVLLRRVALDLTGLPPPTELLGLPYEAAVDKLLQSPHFGEHLAVAWLDAARYADTNGYFGDKPRQMWLWRDWVIHAFNSNMPYDQFSTEQLAGDLLPNATVEQRIATAFNRNHMANNESGSIDEEFRVEYVVDRVNTTMGTWLGITAGCAQCHDHKYDPISQREFYSLFSFFNNVPEQGLIKEDDPPPLLRVPTKDQEAAITAAAAELEQANEAFVPVQKKLQPEISAWEKRAKVELVALPEPLFHESFEPEAPRLTKGTTLNLESGLRGKAGRFDATQHVETRLPAFDPDKPWHLSFWIYGEGSLSCPLSMIQPDGARRGLEVLWQKGRIQINLVHDWSAEAIEVSTIGALPTKSWRHVIVSYDGSQKASGLKVFFDGVTTALEVRRDTLLGSTKTSEPMRIGRRDDNLGFYGMLDEVRLVQSEAAEVAERFWAERISGILEKETAARSTSDEETLLDYYLTHHGAESAKKVRQRLKLAQSKVKTAKEAVPTVLVMEEMPKPRVARVLDRGQYDKPGEKVSPGVPPAIAPWPSKSPRTRLGLAQWIFSDANPLTPRVAANRFWLQCFGEGLVRTVDDFGSQGEPPTHPELLDFLAGRFRSSGWNVKALLKEIVTSRTYRQRSRMRDDLTDPDNRLLARGPSGRLSAEVLRDQALALSGLLARKIGGPSVKPFQPPGLWEAVSYNGEETYVVGSGDDLWRRSLYTYVKRQAPPPGLLILDGPTREKCTLKRPTTNTPLQALMLLNDETFVHAAERLADQASHEANAITWMFKRITQRDPLADELKLLTDLHARQRSLVLVAHTILNLDETITKR